MIFLFVLMTMWDGHEVTFENYGGNDDDIWDAWGGDKLWTGTFICNPGEN